jgi:hypothetical protein
VEFQRLMGHGRFGFRPRWSKREQIWRPEMSKNRQSTEVERVETPLDLSHLRRESRTALELAVVALAPADLVDRLAISAGLLEALAELPTDSAPVMALVPKLATRTRSALDEWQKWQQEHLEKRIPRG